MNWQCCLAGSSKTAPGFWFYQLPYEVKNIEICAPAFFKHNNSFIATVITDFQTKPKIIFDIFSTFFPKMLKTNFLILIIWKISGCDKRNYLDAKSVKTHCRRFHSMNEIDPISTQTEAQFICQVRGCRKLFVETVQIEAHLKVSLFFMKYFYVDFYSAILRENTCKIVNLQKLCGFKTSISFSSSNTQFYEFRIFCLFREHPCIT